VRLDTPYRAIADRVGAIMKDIAQAISFGVGRNNEEKVEHDQLDDAEAWHESDMEAYRPKAAAQLGTGGCALWVVRKGATPPFARWATTR
jgi:tRNA-splicing ligase RtcB